MKKSTKNNNFLKEGFKGDVSKHHQEFLGTTVPKGYFSQSKISILDKVKEQEALQEPPKKQLVFWMQPQFRYIAVASLVFLLSVTVWLQYQDNGKNIEENSIELIAFSEDVLINSLLVDDTAIDDFADATLIAEVLVKAELSEQKLEDLMLNSMILEDSLLDDYMDDELINSIIL